MSDAPWFLDEREGLTLVRCELLAIDGVRHAFSTRWDADGEAFDLGGGEPDEGARGRRKRLGAAAGLPGCVPVALRQVHGTRLIVAAAAGCAAEADGAIAGAPGVVPAVRTADCVPLLLADSTGRAMAAVHAGWRGTAAGIAAVAVRLLLDRGISPDSLNAALGPAIGGCCYEVGPEVLEAVGAGARDGSRLDLREANREQLLAAGVPASRISVAPWCTACDPGLFFSYRRDGVAAGRMMALIGRSGGPTG